MPDIIDKIGRYFAEQEEQLRRAHAQAAVAPAQFIVYRSSQQQQQQQIPVSQVAEPEPLPSRSSTREPSLLRRRFSAQNAVSAAADASPPSPASFLSRGAKSSPGSVVVVVPPLVFSQSPSPHLLTAEQHDRPEEQVWEEEGEGLESWRSARSHPKTDEAPLHKIEPVGAALTGEGESSDDDESDEDSGSASQGDSSRTASSEKRSSALRKLVLKRSGSSQKKKKKKKRRGVDKPVEADAEQLKRENEQKVAAALVLAQERARRIQAERELQMRAQESARREEQRRVQEEMDKIEAIRQKSKQFALRLRPNSVPSTPDAGRTADSLSARSSFSQVRASDSLSGGSNGSSTPLPEVAPPETEEGAEYSEPTLLDAVERRLRDRMVLELRVRERALHAQEMLGKELRRVRSQLERQRASNEKQQQRVCALDGVRESLERELAKVLEDLQASRAQRIDLEDVSRKERAQRQRDAEKQLRARVRAEERSRMADEERVRAEIAADARARAGQRVVSRASSLKKKAHEAQDARRPRRNNCEDDGDDDFALPKATVRTTGRTDASMSSLLLPPELAEFEEEGLLDTGEAPATIMFAPTQVPTGLETLVTSRQVQEIDSAAPLPTDAVPETHDEVIGRHSPTTEFSWRLPPLEDRELFTRVLLFEIPSP